MAVVVMRTGIIVPTVVGTVVVMASIVMDVPDTAGQGQGNRHGRGNQPSFHLLFSHGYTFDSSDPMGVRALQTVTGYILAQCGWNGVINRV
jgi:hypothetical protein